MKSFETSLDAADMSVCATTKYNRLVLSRLIRIINVSIAAFVVILAAVVYWLAVRPLPKVSGEIPAPISAPASIKRDARGVPHIEAASWQDAIFLQGFVTAQDRLWQMDGIRRFAAGELSEVFGPGTLATDERARRMRMRAIAEAAVEKLPPEQRTAFVEYARGVNYFIDTHRGDYSLEFSLPGHSYDPRPWTVTDTILVGLVMFRNLTDTADSDFERGEALASGIDPTRFHVLFPATEGEYISPGSNAWAVSGAHAADGKPMASNDPHLDYGIPGTWYMAHLKAPGFNVSGVTLPGVPCIISGHNDQIAWGVTNLQFDTMDLYREQLDLRTGRYLFKGAPEQARLDHQVIAVMGAKPVVVDTWVTRHGPVVSQNSGKTLTMRWTAADGFGFPFLDLNRAHDWQQFRAALSVFWGPPQNFIYADRAGNIGYQGAGRLPVRHNFDGDIPLDGTSGNFEWDGYIPFEQMPSMYNPPSGIIATANQNTFPTDYPFRISGSFADKYRVEQIRALLAAKPKLTVDDMLAVQKDVYSAYDHFLAKQAVAAYEKLRAKDDLAASAVAVLRPWNGQMDKDEAAPAITELLSQKLGDSLVRALGNHSNMVERRPRPEMIENMLRNRPDGWVTANDWDRWLLRCLDEALATGRQSLGSPVSKWRWGHILRWKFDHPVGKQLPLVDGMFDIGPVEMSGSGTTVKQTTARLGPSERMDVDLGDLDKSVQNLVVGESGFVASGHYKDQWPAYYVGTSFPMEFDHVDARETLRVKPGK
jgi:penicillin amidase